MSATEIMVERFGGLSAEAYVAGASMLETLQTMGDEALIEMMPHLLFHIAHEACGRRMTAQDATALADSFEQSANILDNRARVIESDGERTELRYPDHE